MVDFFSTTSIRKIDCRTIQSVERPGEDVCKKTEYRLHSHRWPRRPLALFGLSSIGPRTSPRSGNKLYKSLLYYRKKLELLFVSATDWSITGNMLSFTRQSMDWQGCTQHGKQLHYSYLRLLVRKESWGGIFNSVNQTLDLGVEANSVRFLASLSPESLQNLTDFICLGDGWECPKILLHVQLLVCVICYETELIRYRTSQMSHRHTGDTPNSSHKVLTTTTSPSGSNLQATTHTTQGNSSIPTR